MCGILGYSHIRRPLPDHVLADGLHALTHRGPDRQQGFVTPHVSLGAARLRIVDVAHGDQPMHNAEHGCTIAFNGEIYNHAEIRDELIRRGWSFRTHCDTEVALNAFLEWGDGCFARFRGMFAIALWHEQNRQLTLARDAAGIKPLYYRLQDGEIYFGSELKTIFAHPEVPRRLDLNALNCFLALNYVPCPMTLIEGIVKLPPGHLLTWSEGRAATRSFAARRTVTEVPRNLDAAREQLDGLLHDAVQEQMISEVPLGIWLSGGLDSSTITHYAVQSNLSKLKTFSVTFNGRSFDEAEYVRMVARHYGTDHHEIDLNENADLASTIEAMSYYSDEPSADAGAVPVWYLSKLSREHVTVALSGEGADELFGGYLTYKANRLRRPTEWIPRFLLRGALAAANRIPASDEKIGLDYKIKRFLQGALLPSEAAHLYWNGTFGEAEKQELFHFADPRPMRDLTGKMNRGGGIDRYLDFDQRYSLPDALLYKVDRMSMAHSLEVRPPFLDDRIVAFARSLPGRWKLNGLETKHILRSLMRERLPQAILQRPKVGLDIPIHAWFRGVLRPLLEDTLNESSVHQGGLFHWPALRALMDTHQARKANWGYHLWGLMTLSLWMKRWKVEVPSLWTPVPVKQEELCAGDSSLRWRPASYSAEM